MAIATVLLVDDEPAIRKVGMLSLQAVGKWKVLVASSGAEALTLAAREQPDVILLDVMMPELDGPAVLAQLRADAQTASLPVIFLTASVQKRQIDQYLALGAIGVIAKPFDPMTLPAEVRRLHATRAGAEPV